MLPKLYNFGNKQQWFVGLQQAVEAELEIAKKIDILKVLQNQSHIIKKSFSATLHTLKTLRGNLSPSIFHKAKASRLWKLLLNYSCHKTLHNVAHIKVVCNLVQGLKFI
ncbi:MAG: hypothetical protein J5710_05610 [Treponema sp.]|nr:hypothetical protein [Treponema sp.]